jgi:hypothetical protein
MGVVWLSFFTLALDGSVFSFMPVLFNSQEMFPFIHQTEDWLGHTGGQEEKAKEQLQLLLGIELRTFSP